jgi:glycosyltransferase involved in cell wall biosynthesis/GT2 family glycosyltransferase
MSKPVVSVTVCMHNAAAYVCETLDSLFAQTFQDFEVIVVDDGSTDGSAELVERRYADSRLKLVRQRQQTLRIARPVSLAHCSGEYFAILDSDDLWSPAKLARQVAAARAAPGAGLVFSDCGLIDPTGQPLGRLSDQFDFASIDLTRGAAHLELLRRGNFVSISTAFAPMAAVRRVGGFNYSYQYVNDYDLWLRLARLYDLAFVPEPLAQYRIHATQFTQRHPEITLPEQCALLDPILRSASYPSNVRIAIGDNLLGQHRLAWRALLRQRRPALAARAAIGLCRYPSRLRDSMRHRLNAISIERPLEKSIGAMARARAHAVNEGRRWIDRARRVIRLLRGQGFAPHVPARDRSDTGPPVNIWIDGSPLGREQTGYFSLLSELIRTLARSTSPRCVVHVTTPAAGRAALLARLGADGARIRFHRIGWRALHWSQVHHLAFGWHAQLALTVIGGALLAFGITRSLPLVAGTAAAILGGQLMALFDQLHTDLAAAQGRYRHSFGARVVRYLWRRFPAPRRRAPANTVEVLFWRGRFKWRNSRRIAIVQDLTTRIHPELHTAGNVTEFDEFLGYLQRHAQEILTVSEHSRQDIIERIAVAPHAVSVLPMPIHPQYVSPTFSSAVPVLHRITTPYVLCVGAIEPRKNLRRLVKAFELVKNDPAASQVTLVLVGPSAWDPGFTEFLSASDAVRRIHMPGFVPLDHLPSLYHFASAVICPSVYEGFGIPVMEAMCSSAIVLTSNLSSLPEVVGPDGIQFDPYDTEAIAGAMLRALTMPAAEAANYRRRLRERASTHLARAAQLTFLVHNAEHDAVKVVT